MIISATALSFKTAETCETAGTSANVGISGTFGIVGPSEITGLSSNSKGEADDMIESNPNSNLRDGEVTIEVARNVELISENNYF